MNNQELKDLRIHIAQAEEIRQKANNVIDKEIARYLVKRLKKKMLNLMYPKTKEL